MGKGSGSNTNEGAHSHQSRPLAALKDPDAFGPPPKNVRYYGSAASPTASTFDRSGPAMGVQSTTVQAQHQGVYPAPIDSQQEQEPSLPVVPFRANTTGLSTWNLPKPPTRHTEHDTVLVTADAAASKKPKPLLPPRLPPRQNSTASPNTPSSPRQQDTTSIHKPYLQQPTINEAAVARLGAAGASLPSLGIGGSSDTANPWRNEPGTAAANTSRLSTIKAPDLNELQSKFGRMSSFTTPPDSPAQGTTFAEKKAAMNTIGSFRNDPSSVSFSEAKNAASTANGFRERHGDQVTAGWEHANGLNRKYGLTDKLSGLAYESNPASNQSVPSPPMSPIASSDSPIQGKKAPPPPPPKKISMSTIGSPPPPVPLSSKPKY